MNINNMAVKKIVLDVLHQKGFEIIRDLNAFEEAINSYSPRYYQECFLVMEGLKLHLIEFLMLNGDSLISSAVSALKIYFHFEENDALYILSLFGDIIEELDWMIEIANIDEIEEQAFENGRTADLHVLALAYFEGIGVAQDYMKAYELFDQLKDMGDDESFYYLGWMNEEGLGTEVNHDLAVAYYKEGCALDENECFYRMGVLLMNEGHPEEAISYFKESEDPRAYSELGYYYLSQGLEEEAFQSFLKGTKVFEPECLYQTAMMYLNGQWTVKDEVLAVKYFTYAYYGDHPAATRMLGKCLIDGIGANKDEVKGVDLLEQAKALGDKEAVDLLIEYENR